jgi:outer membrane protein TolC
VAQDDVISLAKAIELGRRHSFNLKSSRAQADSADASASSARAGYYPTLTGQVMGQGTAQYDVNPQPVAPFIYRTQQNVIGLGAASASLRWTVYDFGKTGNGVDSAEANATEAHANVANTELGVVSSVVNAYVTLAYKEKLRDVMKATLSQRERLVILAKGMVKQGLQPQLEEIRAVARADSARRDLASSEADVLDARAVLTSLLGMPPSSGLHVSVPHFARVDTNVQTASHDAEHLPSVVAAQSDLESKNASVDQAYSRYLPNINLQSDARYSLVRYDDPAGITYPTRTLSGGIVITGTIFDLSLSANVDAAKANAAASEASLSEAKRDATREATRAAFAVTSQATMLENAKKAADGAAAVLTIVQARYLQGLSSPVELIQAESDDSDARVALATAEMSHALAVVQLLINTGRPIREGQ